MSAPTHDEVPLDPASPDRAPEDGASRPAAGADAIADALRAAGCVFAEEEAQLLIESAVSPAALRVMVAERARGVPLEHVVGWAEFCGLRIWLQLGVFVPRRRSEFLARRAAMLCAPGAVVVDLACGSGAVGAAIAAMAGTIELHAVDIDQAAVDCARRNLARLGGQVYAGDLYGPLPGRLRGQVAVIAANLPYVPTEAVATCRPKRGSMSRWWLWTVAQTGLTSCAGLPPGRLAGSGTAVTCWLRPQAARRRPRRPRSQPPGCRRLSPGIMGSTRPS